VNNNLERFLDRRAGAVLCFFATIADKLRLILPGSRRNAPVKRLIFVKPVEQGALVLAYDAFKQAADKLGRENVFAFVFSENREILDILDVIPHENIITARGNNVFILTIDLLRALFKMRRAHIDTAIDLEIYARLSILICWLCGAKKRVGLHRFNSEGPYRGSLVTHRVQYNPYLHISQAFDVFVRSAFTETLSLPLLKEVPQTPLCPLPPFIPKPEELQELKQILKDFYPSYAKENAKTAPLVLFNPKSLDELPARKWADENFVALGQKLLKSHPNARIIITGLSNEQQACEAMAQDIDAKQCLCLAGRLSLRGLMTLMTLADALVTSDSGPAHFAALTPIGGVVLFGPETPLLYSPLSDRMRVIHLGFACSPCFSPMNYRLSPCKDNQCLKQISVEQVHRELCLVLDEAPTAQRQSLTEE
jgi:ADP-heptose:LPS heptosyltransferase